jgi:hypothetical protein
MFFARFVNPVLLGLDDLFELCSQKKKKKKNVTENGELTETLGYFPVGGLMDSRNRITNNDPSGQQFKPRPAKEPLFFSAWRVSRSAQLSISGQK